jgi:hypothetical protein
MAGAKKNKYLIEKPTEPFRMRFSEKYAKKIVTKVIQKADDEDRSFPGAIERMLVEHLKLK